MLFEDLYGVGVRDAPEFGIRDRLESLDQSLVHERVEESHLFRRVVENVADDIFQHRLRDVHIVRKIRKRHFRLDHPEFSRMARRV